MPRGLPTKGWRRRRGSLNATTITRILDAIEEGVPDCHASALAGVARTSWYRWKKEFPELAEAARIAEDRAVAAGFQDLRAMSKDRNTRTGMRDNWTALARWLEARSDAFRRAVDRVEQVGTIEHVHRIEYVDGDETGNPLVEDPSAAQGTGASPEEAGVAVAEDPDRGAGTPLGEDDGDH